MPIKRKPKPKPYKGELFEPEYVYWDEGNGWLTMKDLMSMSLVPMIEEIPHRMGQD